MRIQKPDGSNAEELIEVMFTLDVLYKSLSEEAGADAAIIG
jgi:hypothetical protein